jgi:Ca2+-binding EF-hand superfamily protein
MGQCCTSPYAHVYKHFPAVLKQKELYDALLLSENDIGRLLYVFHKIDHDKGGSIDIAELLAFLDLEKTPWSRRIFTILDEDGNGTVDFREFVVALWNYCSLGRSTLPLFAFDTFDVDSSGRLTPDEVVAMLKEMYGRTYNDSPHAKLCAQELDKLGLQHEDIGVEQFKNFAFNHPALLFQAFNVQEVCRVRIMGKPFWDWHSNKRLQISKGEFVSIGDFLNVHMKTGSCEKMMEEAKDTKVGPRRKVLTDKAKVALENSGIHSRRASKHMPTPGTASSAETSTRSVSVSSSNSSSHRVPSTSEESKTASGSVRPKPKLQRRPSIKITTAGKVVVEDEPPEPGTNTDKLLQQIREQQQALGLPDSAAVNGNATKRGSRRMTAAGMERASHKRPSMDRPPVEEKTATGRRRTFVGGA